MDAALYLPRPAPAGSSDDGYEYFEPTESTVSVWAPDIQHGGPPTGLLTRSLVRAVAGRPGAFTRITTDILGAVGLGMNRVRSYVVRPGRQICVLGAELDVVAPDGTFRTAARASAWFLSGADTTDVAGENRSPLRPLPEDLPRRVGVAADVGSGIDWGTVGFIGATESASLPGNNGVTHACWLRPRIPLVAGEENDDLTTASTLIDIANGVGSHLDPMKWSWMNTDTTLHLVRRPRGQWVGIDAELAVGPDGFGATFADLFDQDGFVGRSAQTVLLAAR